MRCCKRLGCWSEGRAQLLEYWLDPDRDRRFFFCQIEAVETAIYLLEAADKHNTERVARTLQESSREAASSLYRVAFKMATGSGKTVVMAMIIAWQVLNRLANPQDKRFSDAFLIVAPGITIRDRLRVLLPEDPQNFYRQRDVVTNQQLEQLRSAKIVITDFHGFLRREWTPLFRTDADGTRWETPQEWAEVRFVPTDAARKKDGPTYRHLAIREPMSKPVLPGLDLKDPELPFPTLRMGKNQ